MKSENKYLITISTIIIILIAIYFIVNNKNKNKEESSFKLPRWLKLGVCNPCPDPKSKYCLNGCWKTDK